jgi:hypothetical protein
VRISPLPRGNLPLEADKSHYYAARETDASPVQVGSQHEKFLFYRGLASFPVPVSARVNRNGTIAVQNTSAEKIGLFVLFEKKGARLGYRLVHGSPNQITLHRPQLTSSFESLRQDLETALTKQGLYTREARAMVETWRDSWFEEGTRLFYLIPQASVDAILPLEIEPRPAEVVRVFVGRLELITPDVQTEVEHAIRQNDLTTLARHGRFLEPIARGIADRFSSIRDRSSLEGALKAVAALAAPAANGSIASGSR